MASFAKEKFSRLEKSIEWSEKQLAFPRKKRIEAIQMFVGYHAFEDGYPAREYVNSLALAVQIYVRLLAAKSPRVLMSHPDQQYMPTAANFELALNKIPDEINLDLTLRRLVMEALFSMGIAHVGLNTVGTALGHSYGQSFVDVITIDDYFYDVSAKSWETIDYEGHKYWMDYDEIKESKLGDELGGVDADEYTNLGINGEKRAESIANNSTPESYKKKIQLQDVWLLSEKLLITSAVKSRKILKTIEWDKPKCGPYYKLRYSDVPGNLSPLPPVSLWRDLHELENNCFRKLADGAEAQKTVLGFQGGNDESIEDFKKAKDGDGIKFNGPAAERLEAGGANQSTMAFTMQVRDLFSYFAGNLDSVGGLGLAAQTVGQEKLLGDAAGAQLRDMADLTIKFIKDIFKALAYYEWTDPVKRRMLQKPIPGLDASIPVEFSKESKVGEFDAYDLDIDIYSLQDDSPQTRLQKLGLIMQSYILPLAPQIQQNGGTIDIEKIIKTVAKYANMPEISEIVKFADDSMAQQQPQGGEMQSGMSANTTRTYERVGRPGMTREGASRNMQQMLLGSNPGGDHGTKAA